MKIKIGNKEVDCITIRTYPGFWVTWQELTAEQQRLVEVERALFGWISVSSVQSKMSRGDYNVLYPTGRKL
jgi:hypothetical protein